jgi:hypothetical protein
MIITRCQTQRCATAGRAGPNRSIPAWSANGKCALSRALFRRVEVPLALK